ncbi:MAG: hypothetical protein MUC41_00260 [Syntrophobacteraceae bacterium]|jgi:hypothetical protein|nr:hypothetical protein [Syntrophobacteraceae bacterium]
MANLQPAEAFFDFDLPGLEGFMNQDDEKLLRMSKEIVIKFIELGRVSPSNFDQQFRSVFWTLKDTLVGAQVPDLKPELLLSDRKQEE